VYREAAAVAVVVADVVVAELRPELPAVEAAVLLRQQVQPIPAGFMAQAAACAFRAA
jgi:hypothetical protein